MKNIESWNDVIGYEGVYKISKTGLVNRLPIKTKNGDNYHICKERLLINTLYNTGYYRVGLTKNGKQTKYYIHRLVAQAFIPNPENKEEVNHINGIKTDNRVENLEWCTISENSIHAYKLGLREAVRGSKSTRTNLREKDVLDIRILANTMTNTAISKIYNVTQPCISEIINRKTWTHI